MTWGYDALNRRSAMTDVTGTTQWSYDAASRVTVVAAPQGGVTYTYNPDGSRATMTLPGGKTVSYGYDNVGRLASVSDWLSRAVTFSYTVDGLQAGITRPDGVVTAKTYDGADRLTGVTHSGPGNTPLRHFTYTLDAAGNRTAVASDEGTESYTLDLLGRVLGVTYPQGDTTSYSYDPNGNRLTKTSSLSGNATYTYDDADELLSDGTSAYTYDANGNLLTAGSSVFTWDYANRLATSNVAGVSASYAYDGEDTRISKTAGGPASVYVWDREAGLPTLAGDATNNYLSDMTGSELGQLDASSNPTYYLGDGLGSVRGTAGMPGTLSGTGDYDVFGLPRPGSSLSSTFRFTGEQWDGETNSVYLRARYLSVNTGRFMSADSVMPNGPGTQGFNAYSYAANNPTTWTDPSGHGSEVIVTPVVPWFTGLAPLNFPAIPITLAMPAALTACIQYVEGCAQNEPTAQEEAESGLVQAQGPGAGALGVWAVICWLTPECLTEAFLWITVVCNTWGGGDCMVPLPITKSPPQTATQPGTGGEPKTREAPPTPPDCGGFEPGPYSPLSSSPGDPPGAGPFKDFTAGQRKAIKAQNRADWGDGSLHSDISGEKLNEIPNDPNEAVVDHICPKSKGGSNRYTNACLLSRSENGHKFVNGPYTCNRPEHLQPL